LDLIPANGLREQLDIEALLMGEPMAIRGPPARFDFVGLLVLLCCWRIMENARFSP